jgi:signal transduction histidine kinase
MDALADRWRRLTETHQQTIDLALAGTLGLATVADWALGRQSWSVLVVRLVLASTVLARRRYPLASFAVAIVARLSFTIGPEGYVALVIDAYAVGAYGKARWSSLGVLLVSGITFVNALTAFLVIVMAWMVGDAFRDRRAAEAALESERAASDRGALEERARIARELHDVVAHTVSVMVVQAEAARNMLERDTARASQSIDAIASTGREALAELRRMLHVLGPDDQAPPTAPAPTAADIEELVERVRTAGLQVELRVEGQPRELEAGLSQTAYRVVQEALTNAMRYAAGAPTEVLVGYGAERLTLEVADRGGGGRAKPSAPGSGNGLRGLRERVAIFGGELSTTRTEEGGFAVRASLPWRSE